MTVITVASTDTGRPGQRWEIPQDNTLNMSPIPRGLRDYGGTAAIAALGAGDETVVVITLSFPTVFNYLAKSLTINFRSDDATTEFSNNGILQYRPGGSQTLGLTKSYPLVSPGAAFWVAVALSSDQVYEPQGTWRNWNNGPAGDTMVLLLADISGDTSTAGDVAWTAEFWEYDIEQCLKWPVNTPQPTLTY